MNEQKDKRPDPITPFNADLIYTHGSPPSSIPQQEPIAGEAEASTASSGDYESSQSEPGAAHPSRVARAEAHPRDPAFPSDGNERPIVPPLITFPGNRTCYRHVVKRFDLIYGAKPYEDGSARSEALKYFRGRYSSSDWMMEQDGWLENASLLASVHPFSLNPLRVLYCSVAGNLCCQPHLCFRCNLDQCVEPHQEMFEHAYGKRPFWSSFVWDYEMNARKAGIWTGPKDNCRPLYLPHTGKSDGQFFRCCPHQLKPVKRFLDFLFHVLNRLRKSGIIDGWIAVAEPNVSFWPDETPRIHWWSRIEHAFLPHLHILVCGRYPLDEKLMRAIYDVLQRFLGTWSYANVWFNPVTNQTGIKKWINYCLKPFPIARWYKRAGESGCDLANLNLIFDDVVLESCVGIMSRLNSPRRGGVLAINSGDAYILDRIPPLLTRQEMARCKNEKFYWEHLDSFWRTVEKRDLRRGRNFRCRTQSHKAAVRRIYAWERQHESS